MTSEQVTELVGAARRLRKENRVLKARVDGSGGASGRAATLCEFGGVENGFADWSFKAQCHFPAMEDGRVGEAALGKVRAKTAQDVASMERLDKTLFRAVGTKVKGEAHDVAESVEWDSGLELRRRLVRRYGPRATGQRVASPNDVTRAQDFYKGKLMCGIDKW